MEKGQYHFNIFGGKARLTGGIKNVKSIKRLKPIAKSVGISLILI
jgi:hypothetical protein